jgi:NAD(P)-dependent dehydrogenase (short-subunit alcohol dehydrogenase family)
VISGIRKFQPGGCHQSPSDLLKSRVILVTGAGQGLGRVAAVAFAAHGANVILHGRTIKKLEAVYDEIIIAGYPKPAIFPLDLAYATTRDFDALAQGVDREFGRLDGILNSAVHLWQLTPLEYETLEHWLVSLRVNLAAPFALTRACLPLLRSARDASIIVTSETHGHEPAAYWGGFAVAKAGLEALVKIWAQEWEIEPQLRINAFIPGPVRSPQRERTHPAEAKENLPLPEDLIPAYLYLMGPESRGLSGQIINWQDWRETQPHRGP